ncbi:MAG: 2-dehydro-3-deoxygalactonokinase [Aurantimonas endophytica]|uniref:2-dehydro-3-deoxygalactonokinase n=1 Tax=Aurantimonas endophytica TaxID=1522175 RepID=A0A7W6HE32_9HYPH|nr:2-dehydro-3-deoxygalactonokinase [Aurantimonas endophytica]MBB4003516.1 2-dehydro-3-deoxygalactonokinase [Aurantimonas endophytica]MCO6404375.1 2-dehydro-3-deoxygalactonokinase [Aurantimonas endophytica]
MSPFCALVDWGTSSFRLWLVDAAGTVLCERRSEEGMLSAGPDGFATILETHLTALDAPSDLPVVACGMVGARQGWAEAPYVDTPASMAAIAANALRVDHARPAYLLPGVAQRLAEAPDVMRGEETQLVGLPPVKGTQIVCLPGTHSKWVALGDGRIERFATFITGDLFAAASRHTILRHSVADPAAPFDPERFSAAFLAGLERPAELANRLFAIRAGGLLGLGENGDGGSAVSGLLVGLEFAGARSRLGRIESMTLVASGPLLEIYRMAAEAAGIAVVPADAEDAVRAGLLACAREILS